MRFVFTAVVCLFSISPAIAQTKIVMGYSPTSDYVASFAAKDEGFFAKRGLDVELMFIPINSTQPAALVGGSIQASALTTTTFVQAASQGLDLVSAIGVSISSPQSSLVGVMARQGVSITKPSDFIGKKIGVPGIGAVLDIMLKRYLLVNNVNPKDVTFVESGLPSHGDVLRSAAVDAVVTVDPILSRLKASGVGSLVVDLFAEMPPGQMMAVYAMTRSWAASHPAEVKAFQESIREGTEFALNNVERSRAIIGKYSKLPPEVMASVRLPPALETKVTADQLAWWFETMKQQGLVENKVDFGKLILN